MLTQAKVERLLTDLSSRVRAETAAIVAYEFSSGKLTDAERRIAADILTVLAGDVEQQVREALSEHLKQCPFLPPEIARTLAHDVESVALPIIEFSRVLTDLDLIEIVRMGATAKQLAIAKRETVSAIVADALVDTRKPQVVGAVLRNQAAELTETTLSIMLDRHGKDALIHAGLVERPVLPATVAERLVRIVSEELRVALVLRHRLPPAVADEILAHGEERALSRCLARAASDAEVERLAATLEGRGLLSPTLLLRCLCESNIRFFEAGMARLAGIPTENASALIHDEGPLGFRSLYAAAQLPAALYRAFRTAVGVYRDQGRQADIADTLAARLLTEYDDLSPGDLDQILTQLGRMQVHTGQAAPASQPN